MAMTQAEIKSLMEQARREERAAKTLLKQRAAALRARLEDQLAAAYRADHERWRAITEEAAHRVNQWDDQIAAICRDVGVPEEFRPRLTLSWYADPANQLITSLPVAPTATSTSVPHKPFVLTVVVLAKPAFASGELVVRVNALAKAAIHSIVAVTYTAHGHTAIAPSPARNGSTDTIGRDATVLRSTDHKVSGFDRQCDTASAPHLRLCGFAPQPPASPGPGAGPSCPARVTWPVVAAIVVPPPWPREGRSRRS